VCVLDLHVVVGLEEIVHLQYFPLVSCDLRGASLTEHPERELHYSSAFLSYVGYFMLQQTSHVEPSRIGD
jgi:hypothetical protein